MPPAARFVSVVAIVRNDAGIEEFVSRAVQVLGARYGDYELILVDDGSNDDTPRRLDSLVAKHECLRMIRLSREFGTDVAITAGLDTAIGDYAVVMLAACDPPEVVPAMVDLAERGADIVIGACPERPHESWKLRWGRRLFYRLYNLATGAKLPPDMTSMRLFSRLALNALTQIRQKTSHQRLIASSVGFRTELLQYQQQWRSKPGPERALLPTVHEAFSVLITNSHFPLRLVSYVGVAAASLNLVYMLYVMAVNVFKRQVAEGWTTLSLQLSVMFLLRFSPLVVIAEYLAHMLEESKDRPLYYVADEKSGVHTQTDARKRNVQFQTIPRNDDDRSAA
jgi:dolichol-phosphate mannosyltransferase